MDVAWLRSMAVRLRGVLVEHGVAVSHGQALDLIAALPGLRDWPDLMAFPGRVATCRFDEDAVERIARRVTARHPVPIRPQGLSGSLQQMSLLYRRASTSDAMNRLIVTSGDSAAGHVMQSRIADRVEVMDRLDPLVSGPVPGAPDPAAFYAAREAAYDRDPLVAADLWPWNRSHMALAYWSEFLMLCEWYERVELWIDPGPDAQLHLMRVLDWLSARPDVIEKLYVMHADAELGERSGDDVGTMRPTIVKVDSTHLRTASRAWAAYRRPTPAAWFDLLADDLDPLPHLRRTVLLLLGELPSATTGLGATERLLLEVVAPGGVVAARFGHVDTRLNPARVYGFFDEYRILNRLGGCPVPAVLGVEDPTFGFASITESDRRKRYMGSRLSLSDLGRALLEGRDDFARHNPIHRWWGGTLLTNADLWRWDAQRQRLVPPT